MKKYLSILLALILAVVPLTAVCVSAESTDLLDANLVLHYDFEGADILEAMKDKAPSGTVADDIAPIKGAVNFAGLDVDLTYGTVSNTESAAGLRTNPSADTNAVTGASTWFVRAKLNHKDSNQYMFIVEMRTFGSNSIRPFAIQYDTTGKQLCVAISKEDTPSTAQNFRFNYEYDYASGKYINMAVVVEQAVVEENTVYQASLYVSQDLPQAASDWTLLGTKTIGAGIAVPTEANKLNLMSNGSNGCAMSVKLDDVRLYNKALTLDEIATIIPNGSFDDGTPKQDSSTPPIEDNKDDNKDNNKDETQKSSDDTTAATSDDGETVEENNNSEPVESGCASFISVSALAATFVAGTALIVRKKRR